MGDPVMSRLDDQASRKLALTRFDTNLLIEAGAGSGKTATMAGRVVAMLASGIPASEIVAITFTEAAAAELLQRIRDYTRECAGGGELPMVFRDAFSVGLSPEQLANLRDAEAQLDELTCTTIHGFCQRIIRPYPVEIGIDPGAGIADPARAQLMMNDAIDDWIRAHLATEGETVVAAFVKKDAKRGVQFFRELIKILADNPSLEGPAFPPLDAVQAPFRFQASDFIREVRASSVTVPEVLAVADALERLVDLCGHGELDALVTLLSARGDLALTAEGRLRVFKHKGKYEDAAAAHGVSKADALVEMDRAKAVYEPLAELWDSVSATAATVLLGGAIREARLGLAFYQGRKRRAALLDFNDLLYSARELLANHESVRAALSERYKYVLVDEFQDTDPLQTEILWRLCGEVDSARSDDWFARRIRPGALFLVGDPKQAIYRFRGADVQTYVQVREALAVHDEGAVQAITRNFRSRPGILEYVNDCFEQPLSSAGQPGFSALEPVKPSHGPGPAVHVIRVLAPPKARVEELRRLEAAEVAKLCASLLESTRIPSESDDGSTREVLPKDIALLAPVTADLYLYERALEDWGIPVSSQAGKSFWRRQEVQDLVALTRVLSDPSDRLALLALLRGPLVGLTDEEILDIELAMQARIAAQGAAEQLAATGEGAAGGVDEERADIGSGPDQAGLGLGPTAEGDRDGEDGEAPEESLAHQHRLRLTVDVRLVEHPVARSVLEKLQQLRRLARTTTPHHVLCQAVDSLRVRPILVLRHQRPQRVLANVEAFLELARPFGVRGLRDFALGIKKLWDDEEAAVEGKADDREDAVRLITMHASKGLEWPIVIPVNAVGGTDTRDSTFVHRTENCLYANVFGYLPLGYEEAKELEDAQLLMERQRLWYVATTRARELLIIPQLFMSGDKSPRWQNLVPLFAGRVAEFPVDATPGTYQVTDRRVDAAQDREQFVAEAADITSRTTKRRWATPSRSEAAADGEEAAPSNLHLSLDEQEANPIDAPQGSSTRGIIMHKLFEEILTGELADETGAITERAGELIRLLGREPVVDASTGLSAEELGATVKRALALPEVIELRPYLQAELSVFGHSPAPDAETITVGVVDAMAHFPDGREPVVVDWKSDVAPTRRTLEHYERQLRAYLEATGARCGILVLATSGRTLTVNA